MPLKLISFLVVLLAITFFIGFNLDNRCDVSFVFYKYTDVPIFVSLLFAYAAGAITLIPFFFGFRNKKTDKKGKAVRDASTRADGAAGYRKKTQKAQKNARGDFRRDAVSADYDID